MNTALLSQMAQLFSVIAVGYLLFKLKYMDEVFNRKLTRLLLDVTLPLLIISSVMGESGEKDGEKIAGVFLISFLMYVFLTITSILIIKLLHFPGPQQGMYMFMHTFANTAFMGFPIINALFGNEALLYTAILNIFFNLFAYTVGTVMVSYEAGASKDFKSLMQNMNPKHLLSPGTIGSVLAIILYFLPVTFPEVVVRVFSSIGGLTSTLAMLLIGATLAKMPVGRIFNDWHVYLFALVKQLIVPIPVWFIMSAVIEDRMILAVMYILFLMPVANTSVLFATQYKRDEELAAKTVFVTTVSALVTVPVLLSVFGIV